MVQEALNERQLAKLKTQYHTKVMLTLEDSGKENWGVVRDMSGKLFDPIDTAQIIGTWSRAPYDNLIHVSLTTPLQALSDRAVLIWTEISERRKLEKTTTVGGTRKKRALAPTVEADLAVETKLEFNKLREKLMKATK